MAIKNTIDTYGLVSKIFHWFMALVMVSLILIGFYMVTIPYSPDKAQLIGLHKSFGLLILFLVSVRLLWRFRNVRPNSPSSHKIWEKILYKMTHVLFYGLMIALPLTGWLMSSAGGYPVQFFGITVPPLVDQNKALGTLSNNLHGIFAYIVVGAIFLHAAGAFKHHFIDKDVTLTRMTPAVMSKAISAVLVIMTITFFLAVLYLWFGR